MNQPINDAGLALLKEFESFARVDKRDPNVCRAYWDELGGVWTIGWGFTQGVQQGDTMTRLAAERRLADELLHGYVQPILAACEEHPSDNELAAMACLAWNIGIGWDPDKPKPKNAKDGFRQSTVLRAHNRGDASAAARAFGLWNKAGGKPCAGLTRRRLAESALYLKPGEGDAPLPMPQQVQPESSLAKSPIIQGTTLAATTSSIALVAESAKSVQGIRESLGAWLPYVAVAAVLVIAGYVIWHRFHQRAEGWA